MRKTISEYSSLRNGAARLLLLGAMACLLHGLASKGIAAPEFTIVEIGDTSDNSIHYLVTNPATSTEKIASVEIPFAGLTGGWDVDEGGWSVRYENGAVVAVSLASFVNLPPGQDLIISCNTTSPNRQPATVYVEFEGGDQLFAPLLTPSDVNFPPDVEAGEDQQITWPESQITIAAVESDDGNPINRSLSGVWTADDTDVVFDDAATTTTLATLPGPGAYLLTRTASDGDRATSDSLQIVVRPYVNPAGAFALASSSSLEDAPTSVAVVLDKTPAPEFPASVDWAVTGGTATPDDMTITSGTLDLKTGTASIDLGIVADAIFEQDETVELTLSNPVNVTLKGSLTHTLTIENDDVEAFAGIATR